MAEEERYQFVEFSVGVQLDDPLTEAEIDALSDQIMDAACGGCEECGTPEHCANPEHTCKRAVVMGWRLVSVDAPPDEPCGEHLSCQLPTMHQGAHRAYGLDPAAKALAL